jgi:hypothetical protein
MTPTKIAEAFAALKHGRIAEYVGGGRIRVANRNASMLVPYYVTTKQAAEAVARKSAAASFDVFAFISATTAQREQMLKQERAA